MKKELFIINNIPSLKTSLKDNENQKYIFLNEKKWSILAFQIMKIILKEKKEINRVIFLWIWYTTVAKYIWKIIQIDRTFLFSEDIIDNQRVNNNQIFLGNSKRKRETFDKLNCNTLWNLSNLPKDLEDFGKVYDLESFWIAQLTSQIWKKVFILKYIVENDNIDKEFIKEEIGDLIEYKADVRSIDALAKTVKKTDNWEKYFENPVQDNFKINNENIRIIESSKKWELIRKTPEHYGPKWSIWYSILRGYNCLWKCQYCYLQSYFKSPDMVKFWNTEDFIKKIINFVSEFRKKDTTTPLFFYDGDSQDSLWYYKLEKTIEQLNEFIIMFENLDNTFFEIRTKCIKNNIEDTYQNLKIGKNTIYAITFSPETIIDTHEKSTASLDKRIEFAQYIISKWGKIGLRFDPFVFDRKNLEESLIEYKKLIDKIKNNIDKKAIFNIWVGTLRLKDYLYKKLKKVNSPLIDNLSKEWWFYKYDREIRDSIYKFFYKELEWLCNEKYICMDI